MATQTTPLLMGRTKRNRVDGYQLGLSRTGNINGLSAQLYGSQTTIGKLVVFSPVYNEQLASGMENPERTVALPDATGDYVINPFTKKLLKDEPLVLANYKVGGVYRVAGVVIAAEACDVGLCFNPQPWPIGNHDLLIEWEHGQMGRAVTYQTHGYARVPVGEDVEQGDLLSFSDTVDDVDPEVGVRTMGSFMKAGNGVQDLPATWQVITGGKAGKSAEIFMGV